MAGHGYMCLTECNEGIMQQMTSIKKKKKKVFKRCCSKGYLIASFLKPASLIKNMAS